MTQCHFEGEVRTEWLMQSGPDRRMRLLEDFAFVDSKGHRWLASAGRVVDGSSIPRMLWALAGSPYTGNHRRASVLHEVACDERARPSKDVHRMFYDAMVCDGVDQHEAMEFYAAVRLFGPDWALDEPFSNFADAQARSMRGIDDIEAALDLLLGE